MMIVRWSEVRRAAACGSGRYVGVGIVKRIYGHVEKGLCKLKVTFSHLFVQCNKTLFGTLSVLGFDLGRVWLITEIPFVK